MTTDPYEIGYQAAVDDHRIALQYAYAEGFEDGREEGYDDGYETGQEIGYDTARIEAQDLTNLAEMRHDEDMHEGPVAFCDNPLCEVSALYAD